MLSEQELKEELQSISLDDFRLSEGDDLSLLLPNMLHYIGSLDSELRDDLIYSAFANWILNYHLLSRDQLHAVAETVLSEDHMFFQIGARESDSVFRRSFSVLLLPLLLISHRSEPLFTKQEILEIKEKLLRFIQEEQDRRGFIEGKGWAHAIAHSADALNDLAQCEELGIDDLTQILEAISPVVCQREMVYCFGEEERLTTPVVAILKRRVLSQEYLHKWIREFTAKTLSENATPQRIFLRSNIKNFLQSLYFRIKWKCLDEAILSAIEQALFDISPYTKNLD